MSVQRLSAVQFNGFELINNPLESKLDARAYSKFKYGDKISARTFGYEMFKALKKDFRNFLMERRSFSREVCFYSAPYDFVPTASHSLKNYFLSYFMYDEACTGSFVDNIWTYHDCKINRVRSYEEDYGKKSLEERKKSLSSDSFSFDGLFAKDKINVFFDDIRITGSHEFRIIEMLKRYDIPLENCIFLYYAENMEGPPEVEHFLNHFLIRDTSDIFQYIITPNREIEFNTRCIKMILNEEITDLEELEQFSFSHLSRLKHLCLGNRYNTVGKYVRNLRRIFELYNLHKKTLKWVR